MTFCAEWSWNCKRNDFHVSLNIFSWWIRIIQTLNAGEESYFQKRPTCSSRILNESKRNSKISHLGIKSFRVFSPGVQSLHDTNINYENKNVARSGIYHKFKKNWNTTFQTEVLETNRDDDSSRIKVSWFFVWWIRLTAQLDPAGSLRPPREGREGSAKSNRTAGHYPEEPASGVELQSRTSVKHQRGLLS